MNQPCTMPLFERTQADLSGIWERAGIPIPKPTKPRPATARVCKIIILEPLPLSHFECALKGPEHPDGSLEHPFYLWM